MHLLHWLAIKTHFLIKYGLTSQKQNVSWAEIWDLLIEFFMTWIYSFLHQKYGCLVSDFRAEMIITLFWFIFCSVFGPRIIMTQPCMFTSHNYMQVDSSSWKRTRKTHLAVARSVFLVSCFLVRVRQVQIVDHLQICLFFTYYSLI